MIKALAPLVAILAALGFADYANMLQGFLDAVPDWIQAATMLISAAAAIAALTPTPRDDGWVDKLRRFINAIGLNTGHAENKEDVDKKTDTGKSN